MLLLLIVLLCHSEATHSIVKADAQALQRQCVKTIVTLHCFWSSR
jgi:hypothetical protein